MPEITTIDVFSQVKDGTLTFASGSGVQVVETDLQSYEAMTTPDPDTLYVITSLTPSS